MAAMLLGILGLVVVAGCQGGGDSGGSYEIGETIDTGDLYVTVLDWRETGRPVGFIATVGEDERIIAVEVMVANKRDYPVDYEVFWSWTLYSQGRPLLGVVSTDVFDSMPSGSLPPGGGAAGTVYFIIDERFRELSAVYSVDYWEGPRFAVLLSPQRTR
jgi:hypothetical protein